MIQCGHLQVRKQEAWGTKGAPWMAGCLYSHWFMASPWLLSKPQLEPVPQPLACFLDIDVMYDLTSKHFKKSGDLGAGFVSHTCKSSVWSLRLREGGS